MVIPLLLYLGRESATRTVRWILFATFGLSMLAVPFTYSRRGTIGLVSVAAVLTYRSPRKWITVPFATGAVAAFLSYAPVKWNARMQTVESYDQDASAQSRLLAWRVAVRMANGRSILGGGFKAFNSDTFERYAPDYGRFHEAHSIFFSLLGEQGYPGLCIFRRAHDVCIL